MRLAISPDYPVYNSSIKNIMSLREQGYLDRETCEILDGMRKLRNVAAHGAIERARILSNEAAEFETESRLLPSRLLDSLHERRATTRMIIRRGLHKRAVAQRGALRRLEQQREESRTGKECETAHCLI